MAMKQQLTSCEDSAQSKQIHITQHIQVEIEMGMSIGIALGVQVGIGTQSPEQLKSKAVWCVLADERAHHIKSAAQTVAPNTRQPV